MVEPTQRMYGRFEVSECDFVNMYFSLTREGAIYGHAHLQFALNERFAYCHVYLDYFSVETAKEVLKDWDALKHIMRTYGMKRAIGTKINDIKKWSKFIRMLGFSEPEEIVINNKPCMMAMMEL